MTKNRKGPKFEIKQTNVGRCVLDCSSETLSSVQTKWQNSARLSIHTYPPLLPPPQASPSPSPVGYSPMTPGAPSPGGYNPHTPGSNIEQGGSDWVTTDILVRVKDSFMDLMGQTGVIRSITVACTKSLFHPCAQCVSVYLVQQHRAGELFLQFSERCHSSEQ